MENKKWPILAQILIGLLFICSLMYFVGGLFNKNIPAIITGIVFFIIILNLYSFKKWALIVLNILLSLNITTVLINLGKMPTLNFFVAISYPVLVLIYFNSAKIRELFR